jgi:hypothetical protein
MNTASEPPRVRYGRLLAGLANGAEIDLARHAREQHRHLLLGRGAPAGRQRDPTLACGFLRRRQDRIRLALGFLELLSHQLERDVHASSVGRYGSGTSARAVTLAESRWATASANSKR